MGYRRRNNRHTYRNRGHQNGYGGGLAEQIGEALAEILLTSGRGIAWLLATLFKSARRSKAVQPPPLNKPTPAAPHRPVPVNPVFKPPLQSAPFLLRSSDRALPYERCPSLLTDGERGLWEPLHLAVNGKYLILAKVRLNDIVRCPPTRRDEWRWFKKIKGYHVDFVLCRMHDASPLLVIELDDRSHNQRKRRERDHFKNEVLRAAGMPIYRIPAQEAYDCIEIAERIEQLILRANAC